MVEIKYKKDKAIIEFPKEFATEEYVQDFLKRLRIEAIAQKSKITEEQIWELSEEIKQKWWEKNKGKFLKGIPRD